MINKTITFNRANIIVKSDGKIDSIEFHLTNLYEEDNEPNYCYSTSKVICYFDQDYSKQTSMVKDLCGKLFAIGREKE